MTHFGVATHQLGTTAIATAFSVDVWQFFLAISAKVSNGEFFGHIGHEYQQWKFSCSNLAGWLHG